MADKSLGQHWLFDKVSLEAMCDAAEIESGDVVLEIGPGLGTLTERLIDRGARVLAIELDAKLADDLETKFAPEHVSVIRGDILKFDFSVLPSSYKIVANIPYYLTSHLLRIMTDTPHKPSVAALLVQKEVAERVAALPGQHSILSVVVQTYAHVSTGAFVPAQLFSPPPKVDSQILIMEFYKRPLVPDPDDFFRVVKAGFSSPRKKLRSSLAGGLRISVEDADKLLLQAEIDPGRRAQTLTIAEWRALQVVTKA